ncbi:MAG: GNAT family N-acetyltransferase, partial [Nocardioidaceae bacterium]
VRLAEPSEYAAVGEITVQAYAGDGFLDDTEEYADRLRDAAARAAGAELWVAVHGSEHGSDVLGSVTYCPPGSTYRELASPGEGEFRMLAVSPVARGRGVGRALVRQCFTRSRELGFGELVICSLDAMTPAHALYRSMGFVRDDSLDWEPVPDVSLLAFRAPVGPAQGADNPASTASAASRRTSARPLPEG